jgi:hypothetical protein
MDKTEEYSTKTIIVFTNIIINIEKFFSFMPVYDLSIECKNNRKKRLKDLWHIEDIVDDIPNESIICMKWNNKTRGLILKTASVVRNFNKNKKKRDKYFLNSVTTNMIFKYKQKSGDIINKLINIKITKTGRFQITGCKDDDLAIRAVQFLLIMKKAQEWSGEELFTLGDKVQNMKLENAVGNIEGKEKNVYMILQTVMKNRNVHVGMNINRESLDRVINDNYSDYISIFDGTTSGAGVNIKILVDENDEEDLILIELTQYGEELSRRVLDKEEFTQAKSKKSSYHTFLCFKSGSCIHSGKGKQMTKTFNNFLELLQEHREEIEDK